MSACEGLVDGTPLAAQCPDCAHLAGDHLWPSGVCMTCNGTATIAEEIRDLKQRVERLERRS